MCDYNYSSGEFIITKLQNYRRCKIWCISPKIFCEQWAFSDIRVFNAFTARKVSKYGAPPGLYFLYSVLIQEIRARNNSVFGLFSRSDLPRVTTQTLKSIFATHKKEKKKTYNQKIIKTKNCSFSICVYWWNVRGMWNVLRSLSWLISD